MAVVKAKTLSAIRTKGAEKANERRDCAPRTGTQLPAPSAENPGSGCGHRCSIEGKAAKKWFSPPFFQESTRIIELLAPQ